MARYKDILDSIEYATSIDCTNRLLAFTKVRNIVLSESRAAQSAVRQIISRFCNVASSHYKMGLWSLDLLQMCALHGGDTFVLHLNNPDGLNNLLAYFLCPEKSKSVSLQIQMKLYYLFKTWAVSYKNTFSSNNFEFACNRIKRNNLMTNSGCLCDPHWLPDRDMYGCPLESTSYDLLDVAAEVSVENKQLHAELRSIFQMAVEARNNDPITEADVQNRFKEADQRVLKIQQIVLGSQAFWNDIIGHLENKPSDFDQIDSGIRRIFESMEQSINFCINALKIEEPLRKEITLEKEGDLNGFVAEKIQSNVNEPGLKQEKLSEFKTPENWYCALCKAQFTNPSDIPNHIKGADHQRHLELRMLIKSRAPVSPPNGLPKDQGKLMPKSVKGGQIDDGLKPMMFKPNIQEMTVPLEPLKIELETRSNEIAHTNKMVDVQMQTDSKELAKPQIQCDRPINVQCIDCKGTFSKLDKLLSHSCCSSTNPSLTSNASPQQESLQLGLETVPNASAEFFCGDCNLNFEERHIYESHLLTPRHGFFSRRRTMGNQNSSIISQKVPPKPAPKPKNIRPDLLNSGNEASRKGYFGVFDRRISEKLPKKMDHRIPDVDFDSIANENTSHLNEDEAARYHSHPPVAETTNQNQNSKQVIKRDQNMKAVGFIGNDSFEAAALSNVIQPIPELPVRSALPDGIPEDALSSEMLSLMQANNITIRRDFFFCNKCCIYLHFDEVNKHINSTDHQTYVEKELPNRPPSSISTGSPTEIYPKETLNMEKAENSSTFAQIPNLPPFDLVKPIIKDGEYIAVFVPASQLAEQDRSRRSFFTQLMSPGGGNKPVFKAVPVGTKSDNRQQSTDLV